MEQYQMKLAEKHFGNIAYGKNNDSYNKIQIHKESLYIEKEWVKKNFHGTEKSPGRKTIVAWQSAVDKSD